MKNRDTSKNEADAKPSAGIERRLQRLEERNQALEVHIRKLRQFLHVSDRITATSDTRELYHSILKVAVEALELDCACLLTLSVDGRVLTLRDTLGLPDSMVDTFSLSEGEGLPSLVIGSREPAAVADLSAETRFAMPSMIMEEGLVSAICAPMMIEQEVFGVLVGHTRSRRKFTREELELCSNIANQAAVAVQNSINMKALAESEEKYRQLYDHAPDMYHSIDANGMILDCNETEASMLGYKKEDIIGKPFSSFLTESSRVLFEEQFAHLGPERPKLRLEREFRRRDGSTFLASLNVLADFDEKGNLVRTRTVTRDISERRKLENEIVKMQKLESIGILAGGLAHDFNNLLTVVLGNINLARMELEPGHRVEDNLMDAEKGALRAKHLTRQLLTFSTGGAPVRKTASIESLIKESAGFLLRGSNVSCEFCMPGDLWNVDVDEGQISQVINNVIINADQAMPDGGNIIFETANLYVTKDYGLPVSEGRYVRITIKDNGRGISPENLQKIFDPFFTTKQLGSGLGLAIAYSIVNRHDGYIMVESTTGNGSAFHIYLPASEDGSPKKTARDITDAFTGSGRILIMDDDLLVLETGGKMLRRLGYEVVCAEEGEKALDLYAEATNKGTPFDAVIMDLTIPGGMGGKEAIARLLEMDPDARAIVSSGYSNDQVMANFRKYGFHGVLSKPYSTSDLARTLKDITGDA